ncbi:hypothetical protein WN605_004759 [Salmonella enterica]|nr:hypothetical protein [Salmonella enterica]
MFTPRGNVGQVFHYPVLSRITELVTATCPDGDNKTPSLVVFGEQAIALPAQYVDHELAQLRERLAATEKQLGESEKAGKEAAEQHRQQQADLQKRLDAAENKLAEATTRHAAELQSAREQHTGEIKEFKAQHTRSESDLQKRLDTELKARQTALDKALKDATDAREAKAAMTGELKALKAHNEQLAALLAGKAESNVKK